MKTVTDEMMRAAQGQVPAQLVLKNARVLNVFSGEILPGDVAICGDTIVGVGQYTGQKEVDLAGRYVVPGFIDAHLHIESSMVTPRLFAAQVLSWGTTTLIADPHEIANVCGLDGIEFMRQSARGAACNIYYMLPSCVPATPLDTSGATLTAGDLAPLRGQPDILGLGEMMNYVGVNGLDPDVHQKLQAFAGGVIDGHAPLLSGKELESYVLSGVRTEHECSKPQEVLDKLRAGLYILAREGSAAKNLECVVSTLLEVGASFDRVAFCTDDKHLEDISEQGHISHNIKKAIALGLDPATAYRCASYTAAHIYGLDHLGAVAAGYQADLVVLDDLEQVAIHAVYHRGVCCAKTRAPLPATEISVPAPLKQTVHLAPLTDGCFDLPVPADKDFPVIGLVPHQITTQLLYERVPSQNGLFVSGLGLNKVAVFDRHTASGNVGLGVVRGFNLHGAIASTVGHDSHNLVVVGDNDGDMRLAVQTLAAAGGGYIVVQDGQVLSLIELPVAGMMRDENAHTLERQSAQFIRCARQIGVSEQHDPYLTLSFLCLPVIPEVRITDRGVFDVQRFCYFS